ncbi:MAG: DUF2961 domain-containing protein [Candidatus Aminicenantes bacterium]|nr:DUF2961 domain-containing protein [Candidatus Aminicenantes bacterium]
MKPKIWGGCLFICLGILFIFCSENPKEITTESLFKEMVDLWGLTDFPKPVYKTIQFSSFDRRSCIPQGPGWFSNSDGFGGEPFPNFEKVITKPDEEGIGEYLMAEVEGPGAIVRLWSAAISGRIKLFLDKSDEPVYEGDAVDFFHTPLKPFSEAGYLSDRHLHKTLYQRDASYVPIPFSKDMRLVWIGDIKTIHFYEVQVRVYEKGTRVKSFSPQDFSEYRSTIESVVSVLSDPDQNWKLRSDKQKKHFDSSLEPGQKKEVVFLQGPQAVERFDVRLYARDAEKALRQTVLYIQCDQYARSQVQSPVGDFFGAAPGVNPYSSLPFTVHPDGQMVCRFPMPFQKEFRIFLQNMGAQPVRAKGSVLPADFDWDEQCSMHLRAKWRVDHDLTASNTDIQDLPFLIAFGKGLYVGTTSYLLNPNPVPTSYGNWWGEGDEKVFVDDESSPSVFGTGSEDYFNYSWSSPDIFDFPYCGQPRNDGPGNRGFVTNFRWQILDPLPFEKNIRFYMELYSHEETPGMSYARISYHYARPNMTDDHVAIQKKDLKQRQLPDNWKPAARMGARDAVIYAAEDLIMDSDRTELNPGRIWSQGSVLTWKPEGTGSSKKFEFLIEDKGIYRISVAAGLTPHSGKIRFEIDQQKTLISGNKETADLYRPFRILLRNIRLKDMELSSGLHCLSTVFQGASNEILKPEVNIDFIWIQKID